MYPIRFHFGQQYNLKSNSSLVNDDNSPCQSGVIAFPLRITIIDHHEPVGYMSMIVILKMKALYIMRMHEV